jgi:alpha-tubulin suppressor-like RCC1 family protein
MKKSLARSMAAGAYHNLIVKDCGAVLSWGCGVFTSTGKSNDGCVPALGLFKSFNNNNNNNNNNKNAEEVITPTLIPNVRAIAAAAGGYHSVLLEKSTGRVLTFGAAALGQLGRVVSGDRTDSANLPVDPIPAPVELPSSSSSSSTDMEVTSIGAGFYNTLITTRNGHLYCSGENQYQQCGVGPTNIHVPMQRVVELDDNVHVVQADGGYCHTLARTIDGHVYSLGCAEDGARGVIIDERWHVSVSTMINTVQATFAAKAKQSHWAVMFSTCSYVGG